MTVLEVVITQAIGAPGNKTHTNSFTVCDSNGFDGPQSVQSFAGRGEGLAIALAQICSTTTYFTRVTTSVIGDTSDGYNPNGFSTVPMFTQGVRGPGAQPAILEGRELTLNFFHSTPTGLPGKLEVRNALFEGEVSSVQGVWQLTPGEGGQPVLDAISTFQTFIQNALGDEWDLCVATGTPEEYTVTTTKGEVFKRTRYIAPWELRRVTETVFAKVGVRKAKNQRPKKGTITGGTK